MASKTILTLSKIDFYLYYKLSKIEMTGFTFEHFILENESTLRQCYIIVLEMNEDITFDIFCKFCYNF